MAAQLGPRAGSRVARRENMGHLSQTDVAVAYILEEWQHAAWILTMTTRIGKEPQGSMLIRRSGSAVTSHNHSSLPYRCCQRLVSSLPYGVAHVCASRKTISDRGSTAVRETLMLASASHRSVARHQPDLRAGPRSGCPTSGRVARGEHPCIGLLTIACKLAARGQRCFLVARKMKKKNHRDLYRCKRLQD